MRLFLYSTILAAGLGLAVTGSSQAAGFSGSAVKQAAQSTSAVENVQWRRCRMVRTCGPYRCRVVRVCRGRW